MDYYRAGYEAVRLGFGARVDTDISEDDLESFRRGEAFARRLKALGRVLGPWPAGHLLPPRGHSQVIGNADRRERRLRRGARL
jgi:hypothetical protein